MLEITTHRVFFFKRKEFWFYNSEEIKKGTYNVFCYSEEKENDLICKTSKVSKTFDVYMQLIKEQTSIIDLNKTNEELFNQINTTFKYHISKAEKTGIATRYFFYPSLSKCREVINEFSPFAKRKNIEWNAKRIIALQKKNAIIISEAFNNEEKLITHVYLHDNKNVVLLHTYHHNENIADNLRGYANKFLHWKDILEFKHKEFTLYDFGGIDLVKHPGISQFKLSFGGNIIDRNSYIKCNPLIRFLLKLIKKLKLFFGSRYYF